MKHSIIVALACALLIIGLPGCGTTDKLESIQISSSNTSEVPTGTISIGEDGPVLGPVQLYVWGNYTNGKQILLDTATWTITLDPNIPYAVNPANNEEYPLAAPPQTLQLSATGLLTGVDPPACSWLNSNWNNSSAKGPAWAIVGQYIVTATTRGQTTPPVYVAVASAPGAVDQYTNTTGACGPSSSGS